jgi:hypothetical protein
LAFDNGHDDNPDKLEIHLVYSIDKVTATFSGDLSGAWADDVGNTYYLRHDLADNTVWYVGLSPLGRAAFAQVFRGTFHPAPRVLEESLMHECTGGSSVPLQNVLTGNVAAVSLGYGIAPPFTASRTQMGDTGTVSLRLGRTELAGRAVPTLSAGGSSPMEEFRLIKLYDP